MVTNASGKTGIGKKHKECPLVHRAIWRVEFRREGVKASY